MRTGHDSGAGVEAAPDDQLRPRDEQVAAGGERAPRSQESSYRRLFETANVGILILDADTGRISDVNPFLVELLGYSHAELAGARIWELGAFQNLVADEAGFAWLQQNPFARHEHLPMETRSGRAVIVEFVSTVCQAGDHMSIQCSIRDVTERERAERALQASEERFRTLVEQSIVGIYVIQDGRFVYLNPKMEEIFGVSLEELCSRSVYEFVAPEDRERVRSNIHKRVQGVETSIRYDLRILHGSGEVHCVEAHGGRIDYGPEPAIMGTMLDITERKRVEEQVRVLNAELEARVHQRTAQLMDANHELEAFSYSVSHDLRAPLRHVAGFVNLLQKDAGPALSERSLRYLTTISQSAKRMGILLDDLLAFSRVAHSDMQHTEVSLDQLVRETLLDFQGEVSGRNIAWTIHPLPPVRADRALLRLVLVNLISNALKFTGGRAEARIEVGCAPSCDAETVIFVRDNGAGFDPRYAGKLFGVFQRLHSREEFEGTGIGLANVQRIVHRHGGRVWAEGAVERGATFFFSLPKAAAENQ